jgi:hypothetical protein
LFRAAKTPGSESCGIPDGHALRLVAVAQRQIKSPTLQKIVERFSRTLRPTDMKKLLLTLAAAFTLASAAFADHEPGHKVLVLKNKDGAAILGYDAVAYFTDNKAVKGNRRFNPNTRVRNTTSPRRNTRRCSTRTVEVCTGLRRLLWLRGEH